VDLQHAMRFGAACGALSTLGLGGTASQPTESQADEFIAKCSRTVATGRKQG
jgi:sugar/nucleoside kinase (ribokinase family)